MAINLPASITGGAQTGFTSPTYTTVADSAVPSNQKQVVVSAIGGTQAGVDVHSISRPFTINFARTPQFQVLGKPNPVTGLVGSVPVNTHKFIVRKGVLPLAGQPSQIASVNMEIKIPAGSDTADAANLRAMLSAAIGTLNAISAGLGDTLVSGIA